MRPCAARKTTLGLAEERESLAQLQMFNVRQPLALLLAAFEQFEERDRAGFGRFLQAIAVVSFRYNVICGRQSNEQEVVYNQIARELSAGEIVSAQEAIAKLRPVYPEDAEFRAAFADKALRTTSPRNNKVVRFILFRLEAQLSGQRFESASAKYSIEHVLPENPSDDWYEFDDQQREASTYRLGNMTLLTTADNRDLGNSGYAEKRPVYQESNFAITQQAGRRLRYLDRGEDSHPPSLDGKTSYRHLANRLARRRVGFALLHRVGRGVGVVQALLVGVGIEIAIAFKHIGRRARLPQAPAVFPAGAMEKKFRPPLPKNFVQHRFE